jgi:hypothetical protein
MTQKQIILTHLKNRGSITSWDAIVRYHVTRLADVVYKLKALGHDIRTIMVEKKTDIGFSRYAKYMYHK